MEIKERNRIGIRTALISSICNVFVAIGKIVFGVIGNSFALIADGVESTLDIISSAIVWGGLKIASEPADSNHPYGHGKAESLAGVIVSMILIAVGLGIGYNGIHRILAPDLEIPKTFTLYVFIIVIIVKEMLYHYTINISKQINSISMKAEAWHHRTDAITTLMALAGVSIAIYYNYPIADGIAGILGGCIILFNGSKILYASSNEIMDTVASEELYETIKKITLTHSEIKKIDNFRIRKSGLQYLLDIEIQVDPNITVLHGHKIAHELEDILLSNKNLHIIDIVIHVEPFLPG